MQQRKLCQTNDTFDQDEHFKHTGWLIFFKNSGPQPPGRYWSSRGFGTGLVEGSTEKINYLHHPSSTAFSKKNTPAQGLYLRNILSFIIIYVIFIHRTLKDGLWKYHLTLTCSTKKVGNICFKAQKSYVFTNLQSYWPHQTCWHHLKGDWRFGLLWSFP